MKQTVICNIFYISTLSFAGLFVINFSVHAQSQTELLRNQNINYWSMEDQLQRRQLEQWNPVLKIIFQSKVICDNSLVSIRDCHIINQTKNMGTVTDANGDFKITADVNDSITFSALGYESLTIVLSESMYNFGYIIKLKPAAYELDELTVKPYSLNMMPISRFEIYTPPLPNQGGVNLLPVPVHPVTSLYNRFSIEGRQKRHNKQVFEETAEYIRIGEKFNGYMVSQITGLKDDELIKFMSFCNFSNDFLLNYSPETIRRAIRQKYAEFLQ